MPGRKKKATPRRAAPSASASRSRLRRPPRRATTVGGTRARAATPRAATPRAATRRAAAPRKKIVPRKPVRRRRPVEQELVAQQPEVEILAAETVADATRHASERPVAIAGQTPAPASEAPAAAFGEALFPGAPGLLPEAPEGTVVPDVAERADRYPQDWFIAILSAALAATVFLPWYRFQYSGVSVGLSGWETGTFGPIVFFLAAASMVLALTRIAGVRVSLPLPHPTIHEAVGWVAIFAVLVKRLVRPSVPSTFVGGAVVQTWTILAPIGVGLVLAFIAGRMTSGPPLVVLPGWRRERAGVLGMALMFVAIGGGVAFGVMNDTDIQAAQSEALAKARVTNPGVGGPRPPIKQVTGRYPNCARGFPLPPGAKPETGVEQTAASPCVWTFQVDGKPDAVLTFFKGALPKAGLTYTVVQQQPQFSALSFSGKKCGTVSVTNSQTGKGSRGAVALQPCPSNPPSPKASSSPK